MGINIEQTEAQFKIMYGHPDSWSQAAKAVHDVLFNHVRRPVAAREHDISTQTVHAFIGRNEARHVGTQKEFDKLSKYIEAGKAKKESENEE